MAKWQRAREVIGQETKTLLGGGQKDMNYTSLDINYGRHLPITEGSGEQRSMCKGSLVREKHITLVEDTNRVDSKASFKLSVALHEAQFLSDSVNHKSDCLATANAPCTIRELILRP